MEYNFKMQRVLNRVYKAGIRPFCEYVIWKSKTLDGDYFYEIADFCGLNKENITKYGKELTDLEWDGNELFFSNDNIEELEKQVISAYLGIKKQLEETYSAVEFDIVVSINQEGKNGIIRFYAIRDEYHVIEPTHENVARFETEAMLIDRINQVHLEKYVPKLSARFQEYNCDVIINEERDIQIVNPYWDKHIYIIWTDEFTMCFNNYHAHYVEDEYEELVQDVENILQEKWIEITVQSEGRWMGSSLWEKQSLSLQSPDKLLKQLFTYSKALLKEAKEKGCVIELTSWNPANCERIVLE